MKYILIALLVIHGLIHLLGFTKAFGLAQPPQLQAAISQPVGLMWLVVALLFLVSGGMVLVAGKWWWLPAALGVVMSQILIFAAWNDAKAGSIVNLILLLPIVVAALGSAPWSFRAMYEREAAAGLSQGPQQSKILINAFHRYVGPQATFKVRLASLLTVVDAYGAEMNQTETVTLLNDMFLLAPPTLIDPPIVWEELDPMTVRATWTNAGNTVSAVVSFDSSGALVNFVSDDRYKTTDGKQYERLRWSTPVSGWREVEGRKLISTGETIFGLPGSEFVYGRFELLDVQYNLMDR